MYNKKRRPPREQGLPLFAIVFFTYTRQPSHDFFNPELRHHQYVDTFCFISIAKLSISYQFTKFFANYFSYYQYFFVIEAICTSYSTIYCYYNNASLYCQTATYLPKLLT